MPIEEHTCRALQARDTALAAIATAVRAEATLETALRLQQSHRQRIRRKLRPAARALLPPPVPQQPAKNRCRSDAAAQYDLEAILRRAVVSKPKTVACMLAGVREARTALLSLTPCTTTLETFVRDSQNDPMAPILFKIVREAVCQCDDNEEYYKKMDSAKRFSGRTLPPFAQYDDDDGGDDSTLSELSDKYWDKEFEITDIHKSSLQPLHPGFSSECICILCHAFEADVPSPIGINLFEVVE